MEEETRTNGHLTELLCASPIDNVDDCTIDESNQSTTEVDETNNKETNDPDVVSLHYGVEDRPPIALSLLLAFQNVIISFGYNLLISFTVADITCADMNDIVRAKLFCTSVFLVGITTVVQSAFGMRLPMFQGASAAFLGPLLSMRATGIWSCDGASDVEMVSNSTNHTSFTNGPMATRQEIVYNRITQLQGSLMASGLVTEVFLGGTGLLGYLVSLVGPITVCVTITSLGISLFPIPIIYSSTYMPVALCGTGLMILFIMFLSEVSVPIPAVTCNRRKKTLGFSKKGLKLPIFRIFSILLTVMITWVLCGVLTSAEVFPDDPSDPAYRARTDARGEMISITPWFYFPYPGQFGPIRFNTAVFIGFVSSYLSSNIESIGDYMMVSRATGTFPPPRHAINRGILTEGVMGVVAGALGAGHATTSYTDNIVLIKLTQVASRNVTILAGIICIIFGVIGKFGAVMASLPDPIIGGVTIMTCGLLVSTGLSSLQRVNMSSTRNLAVLGTSLYVGLFTSEWLKLNKDGIDTGNASLDQVLKLILGTQMFVAGLTSIILDNTVRGTMKDRGMEDMSSFRSGSQIDKHRSVYDVPGVSRLQRRIRFLRHIPSLQPHRPI